MAFMEMHSSPRRNGEERSRLYCGAGPTRGLLLVALASLLVSCTAPQDTSVAALDRPAAAFVHRAADKEGQTFDWGWIRWMLNGEMDPEAEMTFGVVELAANQVNPLHVHTGCAEFLYVLSGSCEHQLGDAWVSLEAGDLVRIPAGVPHRARTGGEAMRSVIVYSAPDRDFVAVAEDGTPSEN